MEANTLTPQDVKFIQRHIASLEASAANLVIEIGKGTIENFNNPSACINVADYVLSYNSIVAKIAEMRQTLVDNGVIV